MNYLPDVSLNPLRSASLQERIDGIAESAPTLRILIEGGYTNHCLA
jgi:hypothetical protein